MTLQKTSQFNNTGTMFGRYDKNTNPYSMFGVGATVQPQATLMENSSEFNAFTEFRAESYAADNDYTTSFKSIMENYAANGINVLDPDSFRAHLQFNANALRQYKNDLMSTFMSESGGIGYPEDPHIQYNISMIEQALDLRMNEKDFTRAHNGAPDLDTLNSMFENAGVTYAATFIPVPSVDLPVIPARTVTAVGKDIITYEVVKAPVFTKHLYQRYYVDSVTGETFQADKLLYGDLTDKEGNAITPLDVQNRGKGLPISERVVAVPLRGPAGADFNIIDTLTNGIKGQDKIDWQTRITAVIFGEPGDPDADGTYPNLVVDNTTTFRYNFPNPLSFSPHTYQLNDMGATIKGFKAPNGTVYEDRLFGQINFLTGDLQLNGYRGQIKGVVISGFLSNEMNNRALSISEAMQMKMFSIPQATRFSLNISREELDDFKVWQNEDLATRMVNKIAQAQDEWEDQSVLEFYKQDWDEIKDIHESDIYEYQGFSRTGYCGIKAPAYVTDPIGYQKSILGVYLSQMLLEISSYNKMQGLTYVFMIHPEATRYLNGYVEWTNTPGDKMTGITFNSKYGKAVGLGSATVRVVESLRFPFKQAYEDPDTGSVYELPCIDIKAFPTAPEYMTYKHWQYTSYVAFAPQDSMYTAPNNGVANPGGQYRSITSARRYGNDKLQPIAAKMFIDPSFSSPVDPNAIVGKGNQPATTAPTEPANP